MSSVFRWVFAVSANRGCVWNGHRHSVSLYAARAAQSFPAAAPARQKTTLSRTFAAAIHGLNRSLEQFDTDQTRLPLKGGDGN